MEELKRALLKAFDEIKQDVPDLETIAINVKDKGCIYGFLHIGVNLNGCKRWNSLDGLVEIVNKIKLDRLSNEILYRKFNWGE